MILRMVDSVTSFNERVIMKLKECIAAHGMTQAEVARKFKVTREAVSQWILHNQVPAVHCIELEKMFVGGITCEEMNPNVDWGYLRKTKKRSNKGESNG